MKFNLPNYILDLCNEENIKPFSHYVKRDPWELVIDSIESSFLNKKGIYCFWWSGAHEKLMSLDNILNHLGHPYTINKNNQCDHNMVALYIGMTSKAAMRKGNSFSGRLIDRLIRFPKVFQEYKRHNRFELCKRKTGTCGNFDLFNFPETIRAALAKETDSPNLTLEGAENILINYPKLIRKFSEEYKDIFFNNYSISFVPFSDEIEMFYAEALAIGYLRPWLNHS